MGVCMRCAASSLTVEEGEVVAVLGANGAGKFVAAQSADGAGAYGGGRVTSDGADITRWPDEPAGAQHSRWCRRAAAIVTRPHGA